MGCTRRGKIGSLSLYALILRLLGIYLICSLTKTWERKEISKGVYKGHKDRKEGH